jgi:hypothetical protein
MKSRLYVCVKNPFGQRDFERMGIAELSTEFDLMILDCSAWLMPSSLKTRATEKFSHPAVRNITSLFQFRRALSDGGYAMDYVGPFSPQALLMFESLRQRDIKIVVLDSGAFPPPDAVLGQRTLWRKLRDALLHGGFRNHLRAVANRILLRILPDQRPDIALVSGSWWKNEARFSEARQKISIHSFDYERFRNTQSHAVRPEIGNLPPYVVYLDEDITGHEDNEEMGLAAPATPGRFYPALREFFDRFERETGLTVVVAGYPNREDSDATRYGGRTVLSRLTAELIKDSSAVFAHASTAISFAVLWKRPLCFLTSGEIAASWYAPWIEAPRMLLQAPLVNIDENIATPARWNEIDQPAYTAYEHAFIKSPDSPDASIWALFARAVRQASEKSS